MPWIKTGDFHWILVSSQDPRFKEYVRKLREERAREEEEATRAPERGIAPDLHDREKEEEEEEERKQTTEQQQLEAVSDGLFYHQQQELEQKQEQRAASEHGSRGIVSTASTPAESPSLTAESRPRSVSVSSTETETDSDADIGPPPLPFVIPPARKYTAAGNGSREPSGGVGAGRPRSLSATSSALQVCPFCAAKLRNLPPVTRFCGQCGKKQIRSAALPASLARGPLVEPATDGKTDVLHNMGDFSLHVQSGIRPVATETDQSSLPRPGEDDAYQFCLTCGDDCERTSLYVCPCGHLSHEHRKSEIVIMGFLRKKSQSNRHIWQRRLFVLTSSVLSYYRSHDYRKSHDPSGFLELRDVKRVEVGVSGKGSRQGIRLNIHLHSRKRVFELLAGTDKECNQWAEMIEMCRANLMAATEAEGAGPQRHNVEGQLRERLFAGIWKKRYYVLEAGDMERFTCYASKRDRRKNNPIYSWRLEDVREVRIDTELRNSQSICRFDLVVERKDASTQSSSDPEQVQSNLLVVPLLAESSQERQRWAHRLALSEVPVVSVGSDGTAAALSTHPGSGLAGTPGSGKGVSSTTLAQDERPGDRDRATQPGSEREPVSQDWDEDLDEDSSAGAFDPKDLVTPKTESVSVTHQLSFSATALAVPLKAHASERSMYVGLYALYGSSLLEGFGNRSPSVDPKLFRKLEKKKADRRQKQLMQIAKAREKAVEDHRRKQERQRQSVLLSKAPLPESTLASGEPGDAAAPAPASEASSAGSSGGPPEVSASPETAEEDERKGSTDDTPRGDAAAEDEEETAKDRSAAELPPQSPPPSSVGGEPGNPEQLPDLASQNPSALELGWWEEICRTEVRHPEKSRKDSGGKRHLQRFNVMLVVNKQAPSSEEAKSPSGTVFEVLNLNAHVHGAVPTKPTAQVAKSALTPSTASGGGAPPSGQQSSRLSFFRRGLGSSGKRSAASSERAGGDEAPMDDLDQLQLSLNRDSDEDESGDSSEETESEEADSGDLDPEDVSLTPTAASAPGEDGIGSASPNGLEQETTVTVTKKREKRRQGVKEEQTKPTKGSKSMTRGTGEDPGVEAEKKLRRRRRRLSKKSGKTAGGEEAEDTVNEDEEEDDSGVSLDGNPMHRVLMPPHIPRIPIHVDGSREEEHFLKVVLFQANDPDQQEGAIQYTPVAEAIFDFRELLAQQARKLRLKLDIMTDKRTRKKRRLEAAYVTLKCHGCRTLPMSSLEARYLARSYILQDRNGLDLLCHEELRQSAFTFDVPSVVLGSVLEGREVEHRWLAEQSRSAGKLLFSAVEDGQDARAAAAETRRVNRLLSRLSQLRQRYSREVQHARSLLNLYSGYYGQYMDLRFKASKRKRLAAFQYLATNLCEHIFSVTRQDQRTQAFGTRVFRTVTCGAFCDHVAGFQNGGLLKIMKSAAKTRSTICRSPLRAPGDSRPQEQQRRLEENGTPGDPSDGGTVEQGGDDDSGDVGAEDLSAVPDRPVDELSADIVDHELQILRRKATVFSQALSAATTAFVSMLLGNLGDPDLIDRMRRLGFIVGVESLLSVYRDEEHMLSDFAHAVQQLRSVHFQLVPKTSPQPSSGEASGGQASSSSDAAVEGSSMHVSSGTSEAQQEPQKGKREKDSRNPRSDEWKRSLEESGKHVMKVLETAGCVPVTHSAGSSPEPDPAPVQRTLSRSSSLEDLKQLKKHWMKKAQKQDSRAPERGSGRRHARDRLLCGYLVTQGFSEEVEVSILDKRGIANVVDPMHLRSHLINATQVPSESLEKQLLHQSRGIALFGPDASFPGDTVEPHLSRESRSGRSESGSGKAVTVVLALPPRVFEILPPAFREKDSSARIRLVPILISQGVNEMHSLATAMKHDISIQREINISNTRVLRNYVKAFASDVLRLHKQTSGGDSPESKATHSQGERAGGGSLSEAASFSRARESDQRRSLAELLACLRKIEQFVEDPNAERTKNIALFSLVAYCIRLMGGGRVVCCKSAKDRTSMSLTYEQACLLQAEYGVDDDQLPTILELFRREGVRRSNVIRNTGKRHFAFNALQRSYLPDELCPSQAVCGKTHS